MSSRAFLSIATTVAEASSYEARGVRDVARATWRASSLAMRPHDPARSSETWIIPAARRARQVSGRAAEALDARLSAGGRTLSDPFSEDASEGDGGDARGTDEETLVDMLLSGRLEAAPPGAPEEPTVPGPRAFGLRNEARGDVAGGVIPSPAPAPWNQPWPKTRVPGARFHHILDEELIAGSVSPRGPRARRRDVLREVQRALPDHDRENVVGSASSVDDLERRARASGVFQRFATPVFSGENRDARAGTGTGTETGTGSSEIFDRSLRYPGVHSPYESKGETTEEATRRRGGGGVASAEESRRRRIRDKAAALEDLRNFRRALGKAPPPRLAETLEVSAGRAPAHVARRTTNT